MDALTLKQKLQHIQSSNHSIDHIEQPYELALHMMQHIGSTDPVLRDELIYVTFATWIGQGVFSEDQLRHVLQLALDDQHLFYGIGEQGTDSVFTRTFSVLLLPPILNVDRQRPFLDKEDIAGIHHRLTTYLECEKIFAATPIIKAGRMPLHTRRMRLKTWHNRHIWSERICWNFCMHSL